MNDPLGIGEQGLIPMMSSAVSGDASECTVNMLASRVCSRGTKGCILNHSEDFLASQASPEAVSGDASEPIDAEHEEDQWLIKRLSGLLAEIAIAVNGPEKPRGRWGYQDLPERVRALASQASLAKRGTEPSEAARDALKLLNATQEALSDFVANHRNPSADDTISTLLGLHDCSEALRIRRALASQAETVPHVPARQEGAR